MTERLFFLSDTHFGHRNIKKFCPTTRLGETIEEHDEILIRNWNAVVGENDRVYHLGDFCFGNNQYAESILSRLKGKIYFISGNHDNVIKSSAKLRERFEWIGDYKEINLPVPLDGNNKGIKNQKVVLFHFPIYEWHRAHHGAFHLYGHVHGSVQIPGRALDVGVDTRPSDKLMTPWSWEEVYNTLITREIRAHHGKMAS